MLTIFRYNERLLEQWKSTAEQFQQYRHPNCEYGQQVDSEYTHWITCAHCKGKTCISCDDIWHSDISCQDSQQLKRQEEDRAREAREAREARNVEERQAAEWVDKQATRCPSCKAPGIKLTGCDHMTCPQCRHQYCWLCRANYGQVRLRGNTAHGPSCAHHSLNLPRMPAVPLTAGHVTPRPALCPVVQAER